MYVRNLFVDLGEPLDRRRVDQAEPLAELVDHFDNLRDRLAKPRRQAGDRVGVLQHRAGDVCGNGLAQDRKLVLGTLGTARQTVAQHQTKFVRAPDQPLERPLCKQNSAGSLPFDRSSPDHRS